MKEQCALLFANRPILYTPFPTFAGGMKKKIQLLVAGLFFVGFAFAQKAIISDSEQIVPSVKGEYSISGVSANGKFLLVTKPNYVGLSLLNRKTGQIQTLSNETGAGYNPAFSKGGRYLSFRVDDYSQNKRLSTIYKVNVKSLLANALIEKERTVSPPQIVGNEILYTVEGKLKGSSIHWWLFTEPGDKTVVEVEDLKPILWRNGERIDLKVNDKSSYIWVSLSPNRKLLVYYEVGKGTFICNLAGKVLFSAGNILYPKWLNNHYIIGTDKHSPSSAATATDLVAFSAQTGKRVVITNTASINERNPHPFSNGRQIAYQTPNGTIYVVKIKLTK